ncbi:MAG: hypothetical protein OEO77_11750 [Acidimicrobiia bacterium]|nr:hypothetical protein [Acidimicrobiia bacterium]
MRIEDRLRDHLHARAEAIEVPEHRFVETKIVPFQPRRRLAPAWAAAAALVVIVAGGFALVTGQFQTTSAGNEASIIPRIPGVSGSEPRTHLEWSLAVPGVVGPVIMAADQDVTWVFSAAAAEPYPHGLAARTSTDGTDWTNLGRVIESDLTFYAVSVRDGRFVAVGSHDTPPYGSPELFTSTDGTDWQPLAMPAAADWVGPPIITPAGVYLETHVTSALDSHRAAYWALEQAERDLVDQHILTLEADDALETVQLSVYGVVPYAAFSYAELGIAIADDRAPDSTTTYFSSDHETWTEVPPVGPDAFTLSTIDAFDALVLVGTGSITSTSDGIAFSETRVEPGVQLQARFEDRWIGIDQTSEVGTGMVTLSEDLSVWAPAFDQPLQLDAVPVGPNSLKGGPAGVLVTLGFRMPEDLSGRMIESGDGADTVVTATLDAWTVRQGDRQIELRRGHDNRSSLDVDGGRVLISDDEGGRVWVIAKPEIQAMSARLLRPGQTAALAFTADLDEWVIDRVIDISGSESTVRTFFVGDGFVVAEMLDLGRSSIWVGRSDD